MTSRVDLEAIRQEWLEATKASDEAYQALIAWEKDNPQPSMFNGGAATAVREWENKREEIRTANAKLEREAEKLRRSYREQTNAAEAAFLASRLAVTVPTVTDCHVEIEGEQVATFEAGAVNARLGLAGGIKEAA